MYRFLLLLLLPPSLLGCDTGVAFPGQSLSMYRSSLANADVALLKSYDAADVNGCLHDCCTEKYGSCSVASFKQNATTGSNCRLFNCRPVQKCKFVSSSSTDSFSFSSSSSSTLPRVSVPSSSSRHASSDDNNNSSSSSTTTTTTTTTSFSAISTEVDDEQFASKSDNTTVKPRKGVVEGLKDVFGNEERSGSKPRKGVGLGEGAKSKVKPRKGVGPQPSSIVDIDASVDPTSSERNESTPKAYQDAVADDLASALEKVFEDDARDRRPLVTSSKEFLVDHPPRTSATAIRPSSSVDYRDVVPTSLTTLLLQPLSSSAAETTTTPGLLLPSLTTSQLLATSQVAASTVRTPHLHTGPVRATGVFGPTPSSPTILEHSRLIFHESSGKSESESEKKYNASMHLVLSLVFGLLILVSVLGVVAKRVYDSWMRRHYRRMDFLIDGMYNGYG